MQADYDIIYWVIVKIILPSLFIILVAFGVKIMSVGVKLYDFI